MRMLGAKNTSPKPYTIHHKSYGVRISTLSFPREGKIIHGGQRVWMLSAKHPLSSLHHLHLQLFGLLPSPLIPVRRRQVGHAGQRGRMLRAQHPLGRLHHVHPQLFSLLPSPLIPVRRRQVGHARQRRRCSGPTLVSSSLMRSFSTISPPVKSPFSISMMDKVFLRPIV